MDIIEKAAEALKKLSDEGVTVQQGWYDKNIHDLHITLWNLGEYEDAHSDDEAEIEVASIQVNIWSDKDQIALKRRVKKLMKKAGFYYTGSNDNLETDTKVFSSAMRFIAAEETGQGEENE